MGALTAGSAEPRAFGPAEERRLAAFAELAAIAVANADARAELARLAETDPLTGLANRRAFTKRLNGEVERARRHGHLLTLVILDLDDFKGINDTHGHQVGDHVLAEVGRRLCATSRAGELVARIGGEEFAWILPQVDAAGAMAPVERARADIAGSGSPASRASPARRGLRPRPPATSTNCSAAPTGRLYSAKRAGRDAWRPPPPGQARRPVDCRPRRRSGTLQPVSTTRQRQVGDRGRDGARRGDLPPLRLDGAPPSRDAAAAGP